MQSYTHAIYRVDVEPEPIFLRVGESSPELDRWLMARGADRCAFLSAANPGSEALSAEENDQRHLRLLECVAATGTAALAGESYDEENGAWREASLLLVGIDRARAIALALEFGQLALLLAELGKPVELLFTSTTKNFR